MNEQSDGRPPGFQPVHRPGSSASTRIPNTYFDNHGRLEHHLNAQAQTTTPGRKETLTPSSAIPQHPSAYRDSIFRPHAPHGGYTATPSGHVQPGYGYPPYPVQRYQALNSPTTTAQRPITSAQQQHLQQEFPSEWSSGQTAGYRPQAQPHQSYYTPEFTPSALEAPMPMTMSPHYSPAQQQQQQMFPLSQSSSQPAGYGPLVQSQQPHHTGTFRHAAPESSASMESPQHPLARTLLPPMQSDPQNYHTHGSLGSTLHHPQRSRDMEQLRQPFNARNKRTGPTKQSTPSTMNTSTKNVAQNSGSTSSTPVKRPATPSQNPGSTSSAPVKRPATPSQNLQSAHAEASHDGNIASGKTRSRQSSVATSDRSNITLPFRHEKRDFRKIAHDPVKVAELVALRAEQYNDMAASHVKNEEKWENARTELETTQQELRNLRTQMQDNVAKIALVSQIGIHLAKTIATRSVLVGLFDTFDVRGNKTGHAVKHVESYWTHQEAEEDINTVAAFALEEITRQASFDAPLTLKAITPDTTAKFLLDDSGRRDRLKTADMCSVFRKLVDDAAQVESHNHPQRSAKKDVSTKIEDLSGTENEISSDDDDSSSSSSDTDIEPSNHRAAPPLKAGVGAGKKATTAAAGSTATPTGTATTPGGSTAALGGLVDKKRRKGHISTDKAQAKSDWRASRNITYIFDHSQEDILRTYASEYSEILWKYGAIVPKEAIFLVGSAQGIFKGKNARLCTRKHAACWVPILPYDIKSCKECDKGSQDDNKQITLDFYIPSAKLYYILRPLCGVDVAGNILNEAKELAAPPGNTIMREKLQDVYDWCTDVFTRAEVGTAPTEIVTLAKQLRTTMISTGSELIGGLAYHNGNALLPRTFDRLRKFSRRNAPSEMRECDVYDNADVTANVLEFHLERLKRFFEIDGFDEERMRKALSEILLFIDSEVPTTAFNLRKDWLVMDDIIEFDTWRTHHRLISALAPKLSGAEIAKLIKFESRLHNTRKRKPSGDNGDPEKKLKRT